jgi:hypothetical protein
MSNVLDERPRGAASKGSVSRAKRAPLALYGSRSVPSVVRPTVQMTTTSPRRQR